MNGDPGTVAAYAVTILLFALATAWPAPCCNNPVFAEIVPAEQRTLVYAFDRCGKGWERSGPGWDVIGDSSEWPCDGVCGEGVVSRGSCRPGAWSLSKWLMRAAMQRCTVAASLPAILSFPCHPQVL